MSLTDIDCKVKGQKSTVFAATPNGTLDLCHVQNHITPENLQESRESEAKKPDTPCKELINKKNPFAVKPGSKRKLFLQSDRKQGGLTVGYPKKLQLSGGLTHPTITGGVSHFPLTERQQLQYLLEVTAQQAKNEENCSDSETGNYTKIKRKESGKENIKLRLHKKNERGETALHVAAIKGDVDEVISLIKAGANVNGKDYAGWTPLHEASNHGHLLVAKELVNAGASVNSPGLDELTPLHDSIINDHVQVIEFLLQHGANPQLRTANGQSAVDLASSKEAKNLLGINKRPLSDVPVSASAHSNEQLCCASEREAVDCSPTSERTNHLSVSRLPGEKSSVNQNQDAKKTTDCVVIPFMKKLQEDCGQPVEHNEEVKSPNEKISSAQERTKENPSNQRVKQLPSCISESSKFNNERNKKFKYKDVDSADDCVSLSRLNQCLTNAAAEMSSYLECKEVLFLDSDQESDENEFTKYNKSAVSPKSISNKEDKICVSSYDVSPKMNILEGCNTKYVDNSLGAEKVRNDFDVSTLSKNLDLPESYTEQCEGYIELKSKEVKVSERFELSNSLKRNELDSIKSKIVFPRKRRRSAVQRSNINLEQSIKSNIKKKTSENLNPDSDSVPTYCNYNKDSLILIKQGEENVKCTTLNSSDITLTSTTPIPCPGQTEKTTSCASQIPVPCVNQANAPAATASEIPHPFSQAKKSASPVSQTPVSSSIQTKTSTPSEISSIDHTKTPTPPVSQSKTPTSCTFHTKIPTYDLCSKHIKAPSWRRAVAKHRYQISTLPVHVPSFEEFLLHTKSYGLHNQSSEIDNLQSTMKTKKTRLGDLRTRQQVEKEKLKLCVEQELVRVFTNFAREVVGKPVPYSACLVLRTQEELFDDQGFEVPGCAIGSTLKEEVNKVLNKFEAIKQEMLGRQRLEYDALLALEHINSNSEDLAEARRSNKLDDDFDIVPRKFTEQFQRLLFSNCLV